MKYQFIDQAKVEFDEAMEFYDSCVAGLGIKLFSDFENTIERLLHFPYSATSIDSGIRKAVLSIYPFNIIYQIENDFVYILAFMHQKRKPGYWKKRLTK